MSKVKANDKFRFPLELDLGAYLPPEAQDGAVYDLSAILIHKGSSASHGHYGVLLDAEAIRYPSTTPALSRLAGLGGHGLQAHRGTAT